MSDVIKLIKQDEVYFKVDTIFSIHKEIKDYFSEFIKDHWFHPKFKSGNWDGKISYFKMQDHLLPIGLFPDFLRFCDKNNYKFKLDFPISELKTNITESQLQVFCNIIFKDSEFYPRDYQMESIINSLQLKRGILLMATGAGKSLVLYVIIRFLLGLKKNVVLVVPTTSLVEQMYSDFEEYGWKDIDSSVCRLYSKREYDESKPILISTWQSLQRKEPKFFDRFGGLLIDECLHPKTNITLADGNTKEIKDITIGDMVKSYNKKSHIIESKEVLKVHKNLIKSGNSRIYNIEDVDGNIKFKDGIAGNHEVLTQRGLVRVDSLVEGDDIK
jgi:hypothetical protein